MTQEQARILVDRQELQQLQKIAFENQFLAQLMKTSVTLSNGQPLPEMLQIILQGIQAVGFDRVRLYFLSKDGQFLEGIASAGMDVDFIGFKLPRYDDRLLIALTPQTPPQILRREGNKPIHFDKELAREGVGEWAYLPLAFQGELLGLVVIDNKYSKRPIPHQLLGPLTLFASQITTAVSNSRLAEQEQSARRTAAQLRASYEASNALVSEVEPNAVWETIGKEIVHVANADGSRILLIDPLTKQVNYLFQTSIDNMDVFSAVPSDGLSMIVMRTGKPEVVKNATLEKLRVPTFVERGIGAAAGLPIIVDGKPIGVVWVYHSYPHDFSSTEIEALQLYVNQAAIAYDHARQLRRLETMHQAAEKLAASGDVMAVLQQIVVSACQVLEADSANVWMYDSARNQFIQGEAVGMPENVKSLFRVEELQPTGTALSVMKLGWLGIQDATTMENKAIRQALVQMNVHSFQAVVLQADGVILGVLYANYKKPHSFNDSDRERAETFAYNATLSLTNARLLEQVQKVRQISSEVASASTLAPLPETLEAVAQGMRDVLACDVVTLHIYDPDKKRWIFPPTMVGVWHEENIPPLHDTASFVIPELLQREQVFLAIDDVSQDKIFRESRFTRDEEILSTAVAPLRIGVNHVGIMFVSYRVPHRFTSDEQAYIEHFASQSAVAIRNVQLYERQQRQTTTFLALDRVAKTAAPVNEVLFAIAEQAWHLADLDNADTRRSHLALVEGDQLLFKATWPREKLADLHKNIGAINLKSDSLIGVTGQAVKTKKPILVHDINNNHNYIAHHPQTRSELAVPIQYDNRVIGVINVEHPEPNAFDKQDIQALTNLAQYAAVAIHNMRLYRREQRQKTMLEALYQAGQALTKSLDLRETIQQIIAQVGHLVIEDDDAVSYVSIWLVTGPETITPLETHPPGILDDIRAFLGDSLNWKRGKDGRIGIIGRAIETKSYVRVGNVGNDPDYLPIYPNAHSELAMPMMLGDEVIGVINLEHIKPDAFDDTDVTIVKALADQAAIALRNARVYEEAKILQETAVALSGTLACEEIIQLVMNAAMKLTNSTASNILFWDAEDRQYTAYRIPEFGEPLTQYPTTARTEDGFTQNILRSGKSIIITDTHELADSIPRTDEYGRSFVSVPLLRNNEAFAVLFVNSYEPRRFFARQIALLEALAGQAVIAIDKASQHEELKEVKGLVGSRTALAWMGMASNAWRHSIEGNAVNIKNVVTLLEPEMKRAVPDSNSQHTLLARTTMIKQLAAQILESPITPPLSSEEGLESVIVNDLLQERLHQLWENEAYREIDGPNLELDASIDVKVFISPEWLRLALDLVVSNAVDAMQETAVKLLTVKTTLASDKINIVIQDSGQGMTSEEAAALWEYQERPQKEGSLGRGLLIVQAIMQTYGGDVYVADTGPNGTSMILSIPVLDK